MQKGQTQVLILAGIIILIAAAGGIFFLGRVTTPKPQTQTPVVTSSPQPSSLSTEAPAQVEDPTVNWKTYTSSYYGYSFKYPKDIWISSEESQLPGEKEGEQTMIISDNVPLKDGVASISVAERGKISQQSLIDFTNDYMKERKEFKISKFENVIVDDRPAIYLEALLNNKETTYFIFIERDKSHLIILNLMRSTVAQGQLLEPIFNQILSTFKFLP